MEVAEFDWFILALVDFHFWGTIRSELNEHQLASFIVDGEAILKRALEKRGLKPEELQSPDHSWMSILRRLQEHLQE